MRASRVFWDMVPSEALTVASRADLPELFEAALREGWIVDESGAHLLKHFHREYFGAPGMFTDVTAYEVAVNGRGVPDWDLVETGVERARVLARRAYAFAWMALHVLQRMPDHAPVLAYISIGNVLADEAAYTANVTFCATRDDEPAYIDLEGVENMVDALLVLDSNECVAPIAA